MGLRLLLWVVFCLGIRASLAATPHVTLSRFLYRLGAVGTVWFLAFPLLVTVTSLLPAHARHQVTILESLLLISSFLILCFSKVVTATSLTLQVGALTVLIYECTSASEYFKLSSLSHVASASPATIVMAPVGKGKISVD